MSVQSSERTLQSWVRAPLNYIAVPSEKPRTYTFDPPNGAPRTTVVNDPREVVIINGRHVVADLTLDQEGFALASHTSEVGDFYNDDAVERVYYPEAARFLKDLTGAQKVHIFDHTVRRRVPGENDRAPNTPRQPVPRVHVDHTEKSGPQRVRDLLPDEAGQLLWGRVQIINIWRPIRGPLQDSPLAVCDAQTVAPEQLIASDLVYPNRVGETYSVCYDPAHRWFYFPDMRTDEVLLLKCYDSKTDGRARFAPHTAFTDPSTPPGATPRESIELRALVFHPN